jgi:nicotinamide-nucleotide amidase
MVRMWREQALPRLSSLLTGYVYRSANLRTLGIGESAVAELLDELTRLPQPYIGTYAKDDGVHVRITAAAANAAEAEVLLAGTLADVRARLAGYVYTEDERPLPRVLLDTLRDRRLTIGLLESGTGGRFGGLLLSEPYASEIVRGVLAREPFVAAGDPDALASYARDEFETDLGLGILADVRPVPLGLHEGAIHIALAGELATAESFPIRAAYQEIQRRAALNAADVLRRALEQD